MNIFEGWDTWGYDCCCSDQYCWQCYLSDMPHTWDYDCPCGSQLCLQCHFNEQRRPRDSEVLFDMPLRGMKRGDLVRSKNAGWLGVITKVCPNNKVELIWVDEPPPNYDPLVHDRKDKCSASLLEVVSECK